MVAVIASPHPTPERSGSVRKYRSFRFRSVAISTVARAGRSESSPPVARTPACRRTSQAAATGLTNRVPSRTSGRPRRHSSRRSACAAPSPGTTAVRWGKRLAAPASSPISRAQSLSDQIGTGAEGEVEVAVEKFGTPASYARQRKGERAGHVSGATAVRRGPGTAK